METVVLPLYDGPVRSPKLRAYSLQANTEVLKYIFLEAQILFLDLLVFCRHATPFTVLLQFNLARDELAILAGPVVSALALVTGNLYELVLGHGDGYYIELTSRSTARAGGITFPRTHYSKGNIHRLRQSSLGYQLQAMLPKSR